jgi:protein tyrosine phosphatase
MSFVPLITGEQVNEGEIGSISEMIDPVQSVLGGMRVQRMSLVQSLRQYAFVYRGKPDVMCGPSTG